jgi:hypothetical protein
MSTQLLAIDVLQSTDAEFRAWVDAFITAFLAVGLTQTADTGQINVATVLAPSGSGQSQGYAMFEPGDALTKPKYRIDFGSGPAGANAPAIWVAVGWSTDGAGNFTGSQFGTQIQMQLVGGNNGILGCDIAMCHQDSAFAMLVNENNEGSNPIRSLVVIDRYRDVTDGDATADGVAVWMSNNSNIFGSTNHNHQQCIPATGGVGPHRGQGDRFPGCYPATNGTWGRGSNVGVAPLVPWDFGGLAPSIAGVFFSPTDAPTLGSTFNPMIYGVSRTYRASYGRADGNAHAFVAILFE